MSRQVGRARCIRTAEKSAGSPTQWTAIERPKISHLEDTGRRLSEPNATCRQLGQPWVAPTPARPPIHPTLEPSRQMQTLSGGVQIPARSRIALRRASQTNNCVRWVVVVVRRADRLTTTTARRGGGAR
jgi:hypothetical protein